MRHGLVECENTAGGQVERSPDRSDPDATTDRVNRDSPLRSVLGNTRMCGECDEDDAEIVVLHEGLGVVASRRLGLAVKLIELSHQIEFEKRSGHRLRMRSSLSIVRVANL